MELKLSYSAILWLQLEIAKATFKSWTSSLAIEIGKKKKNQMAERGLSPLREHLILIKISIVIKSLSLSAQADSGKKSVPLQSC